MDIAIAIGFASTAATLFVTIALFATDRILASRRARLESRRQLVVRVLDAFDRSVRDAARPAFVKTWQNHDVEFSLLAPRLLVDLPEKDWVISRWLQRQVQRMLLASNPRDQLTVRAQVAEAMVRWQRGHIDRGWFATQLRADPYVPSFKLPTRVKVRRALHDSWAWAQLLGALGALMFVGRRITSLSRSQSSP